MDTNPPKKKADPYLIQKIPSRSFGKYLWLIGTLGLVMAAAVIGRQFLLGKQKTSPSPSGRPVSILELNGGHGGYTFIDDVLLGRAPSKITLAPDTTKRKLNVNLGGLKEVKSGFTIKSGQTRVINLVNKTRRATGTVVFPSSIHHPIKIDGKKIPEDSQVVNLPAGVHHVIWVDKSRVLQKFISIGDGQVKMLTPPS